MQYDWRNLTGANLIGTEEHAAHLDRRVAEMSPKEWRVFRAGLLMCPQDDLAGMIALSVYLQDYAYFFPASNNTELGLQLAKFVYGASEDMLPFVNCEELAVRFRAENGGHFIDNAFVRPFSRHDADTIKRSAARIRDGHMLEDWRWSAKLRIAGPNGNEAWLRLPDYELADGGQADEVASALYDLGAKDLSECRLLEAKCMFPQIDLSGYGNDLEQLVLDASKFGFEIFDGDFAVCNYYQTLRAAMDYENCDNLKFAIDIAENLECYEFRPEEDFKRSAVVDLPDAAKRHPTFLAAFDLEQYAKTVLSKGMKHVDGGYMTCDKNRVYHDYSKPEENAADRPAPGREKRQFGDLLDRCFAEYKAGMAEREPAWQIGEAEMHVATEVAYHAFRDGAGLSDRHIACF